MRIRRRNTKWTVRALGDIGWMLPCTFLINLELTPKTEQEQWTECALAIGVSAIRQKKIPTDTIIEITFVKSATHDQALITDLNNIKASGYPIHQQCCSVGLTIVVMKCSTRLCTDIKCHKIMTEAEARQLITFKNTPHKCTEHNSNRVGEQYVLSVDEILSQASK